MGGTIYLQRCQISFLEFAALQQWQVGLLIIVLATAREWDYGFRLGSIANVVNGATVTSDDYTYDDLNRRTRANLEDGSLWNYSYNDRNELTGAGRFWPDWTPVAGEQYGYGFDNIGNRTVAQSGSAGAMSTVGYTANNLNEYTGIVTPGSKDILGLAFATNTVTVNGGVADRKGEYFHKAITVANSGGPVWQEVTNCAGTSTVTGGLVFPANSQAHLYDADGNLTFDGVWTYQWDAENRLITNTMTNVSGIAKSNRLQVVFAYDYMNRRISKIVSTNSTGSSFVPQSTNYFIKGSVPSNASLEVDRADGTRYFFGIMRKEQNVDMLGTDPFTV
jgi:YD repeat-containing protein